MALSGIVIMRMGMGRMLIGKYYRVSGLVQLDCIPVRLTVYPEVLGKTTILTLICAKIDKGSQRRFKIACCQKPGCCVYKIPAPYQVIAAFVAVIR